MNSDDKPYSVLADQGIRDFMITSDSFYPPNAVALSISQQRQLYNAMSAHFRKERPDGIKVTDLNITNGDFAVPIRIYSPIGKIQLPIVLYLHGGGFVVGDLESHDDICAEIAEHANLNVIAVDYRLAPEHPYPAGFEDCMAVLNAIEKLGAVHNFDSRRLVLAGDSAGGNLAAGLCLYARDKGGPKISGQVLIYPGFGGDTSKGSYVSQSNAPGLSTVDIEFYSQIYAGAADNPNHQSKFVSPLLEKDYTNLPPAFLVAAHHDPLCDDCSDYSASLSQSGVVATVREEPLLVHAFLRARHMSKPAKESFDAIVDAIDKLAREGKLP